MKVYQPATHGKRITFVQPGTHYPVSDWMDDAGNPRMFAVEFIEGKAEVSDHLGQYMIDQGIAARSPIILPDRIAA
jgi:hypothetical protein